MAYVILWPVFLKMASTSKCINWATAPADWALACVLISQGKFGYTTTERGRRHHLWELMLWKYLLLSYCLAQAQDWHFYWLPSSLKCWPDLCRFKAKTGRRPWHLFSSKCLIMFSWGIISCMLVRCIIHKSFFVTESEVRLQSRAKEMRGTDQSF